MRRPFLSILRKGEREFCGLGGRADLACVHVPTTIFHGTKDEIVLFELGRVQQQCIECARLIPFEYSGHGVFYDELERFNQCFLEFSCQ